MTPSLSELLSTGVSIRPSTSYQPLPGFSNWIERRHGAFSIIKAGVFSAVLLGVALSHSTSFAFSDLGTAVSHSEQSKSPSASHKKLTLPKFTDVRSIESYFLDPDQGHNLFAAVATRMESLETSVYNDPARGRNIGIGYNMDAIGLAQARADFKKVGMKDEHIRILMTQDASQYSKVYLSPNQSVALLLLAQPRYEAIARDWLGDAQWASLPPNRQAAVAYLAYQTGGNIEQFKKAKAAILSGNEQSAQKNLTPSYVDRTGKMVVNTRFGVNVGAMWTGAHQYAEKHGYAHLVSKLKSKESTPATTLTAKEGDMDSLIDRIRRTERISDELSSPVERAARVVIPNATESIPPRSAPTFRSF
jgi:hypothetical protein